MPSFRVLARELEEEIDVPTPHLRELPALVETLECKLPNRFEHPEPTLFLARQALLDERRKGVQIRLDDLLGSCERETAHEDGEPREELLLFLVQQLVAPGNRVPEGALPVGKITGASGEHGESLVEPLEEC